jgi:hypothetical protein
MPLYVSQVAVTQKIIDLLDVAQGALGIKAVSYGEQELMPDFPWVSVQSGPKTKEQSSTGRFKVQFTVIIHIWHGRVQSSEVTRKQTEQIAEGVVNELENHFDLDGAFPGFVFGYVRLVEPGSLPREGVMVRVTRLQWVGEAREDF